MAIRRSEIRKALRDRMGQFQLQRGHLQTRLNKVTAMKSIPLTVLLGETPTERLMDELMYELGKQLGTETNIVILD